VRGKCYLPAGLGSLLGFLLFLTGTINLESTPPLWWDEGWLLTVARNWVEQGHYGRFLLGTPDSVSPTNGFPAIAPIALSFRLLGIGIWQGRIVGVLFTLGALALIYHLAFQLYDRSVAVATLVVLLFMSGHRDFQPVVVGRQALGEMPAAFYLLAGYACFLSALRGSFWLMTPAILFWATALASKLQVLPFWTASLLIPLSMALFRKSWKLVGILTIGLLGSVVMSQLLLWVLWFLLNVQTLPFSLITTLYSVSVWAPLLSGPRLLALSLTAASGLPALVGLCHAASKLMRNRDNVDLGTPQEVVRLGLLSLAGSWLAWYFFLSIGWSRYLFPATFIGSIFAAAALRDLTDDFNPSSTIKRAASSLRRWDFSWQNSGAFLTVVLMVWSLSITIKGLYYSYFIFPDSSVIEVARFLNSQTPSNSLIETYESELHFLMNRLYHYPPDQVSVDLNLRNRGRDIAIKYDPLPADPDYLVIGSYGHGSQLYNPVLTSGAFRLLRTYGRYDIYERVR
jgi:hypothetical protein